MKGLMNFRVSSKADIQGSGCRLFYLVGGKNGPVDFLLNQRIIFVLNHYWPAPSTTRWTNKNETKV